MVKENLKIKDLQFIFKLFPKVKLVYFFGSQALGKEGPLSDFDFAVYLEEKDLQKRFQIRIKLLDKLAQKLKTNLIDLCVLNDVQSPELKYTIITEGKLIYEQEPFKLLIEPRILSEFFDFMAGLRKYKLTKNI